MNASTTVSASNVAKAPNAALGIQLLAIASSAALISFLHLMTADPMGGVSFAYFASFGSSRRFNKALTLLRFAKSFSLKEPSFVTSSWVEFPDLYYIKIFHGDVIQTVSFAVRYRGGVGGAVVGYAEHDVWRSLIIYAMRVWSSFEEVGVTGRACIY